MERIVQKVDCFIPKIATAKRVAAYARVSSGKDAMLHSLSAQISYYSNLIQNHKGWAYKGVFTDEAFTGTKDNRTGFQELIRHCKSGEIDMVITKSISRFARNTVTLLTTVRELKSLGVDVYFEEQNIHSASADGELMLSILASYAQEESLSASENQKWRIRKGFENGELMCLRFLYGYKISKNNIVIDRKTAKIVTEVYMRVADGESLTAIARDLNNRHIPCLFGGEWNYARIYNMVTNEKYIGNAVLQKTFVNNHIDKRKIKNKGELPRYCVEGSHKGIISKELFDKVQTILYETSVKNQYRQKQTFTPFTGLIKCEKCGKGYKRSGKEGHRYWCCTTFSTKGKSVCQEPVIPEDILYSITCEAVGFNEITKDNLHELLKTVTSKDKTLTYYFRDGRVITKKWNNPSRSESWTAEMREAARQRAYKQFNRKEVNQ